MQKNHLFLVVDLSSCLDVRGASALPGPLSRPCHLLKSRNPYTCFIYRKIRVIFGQCPELSRIAILPIPAGFIDMALFPLYIEFSERKGD
jgi:hypothetical protein